MANNLMHGTFDRKADSMGRQRVVRSVTMLWRRTLVTQLYCSGHHSQEEIARILLEEYGHEVSQPVISNDIKIMRKAWTEKSHKSTEQWVEQELSKLDQQEMEVRLKMDTVMDKYLPRGEVIQVLELSAEAGHQTLLKIAERRAKLLGLDAVKKIEHTVERRDIVQMSDEQLMKLATGPIIDMTMSEVSEDEDG